MWSLQLFHYQWSFPDTKIAYVIPVHKSGPKKICNNYRPISLLSPYAKIFEKCLYNQLNNFFSSFQILNKQQFGFRQNHKTSLAVSSICNEFVQCMDEGKIACSIFLDLAKAFDTTDHAILLRKLKRYGVRGLPLQLIKSYLTNRYQRTVVDSLKSNVKLVTCGVPQGSILGPFLFLVFINDLALASELNVRIFSDDTNLTLVSDNYLSLQTKVNCEIQKIDIWFKSNKLSLNYNKTEYMVVTRKKEKCNFRINIGGHEISQKECIRYLGVMLDDSLTWKQHIAHVSRKLSNGCWALSQIRKYFNSQMVKKVYFALLYPHIQYCITS